MGCANGWTFQQDNDPKHIDNLIREWFVIQKISVSIVGKPISENQFNIKPLENVEG